MTTARRPPSPPTPKLTRAPAKPQPESKNPITTEIMQRVRRVIVNSQGLITSTSIADELGINRRQFAEWISCYRAQPYGDNLIAIIRWLIPHDLFLIPEVFTAIKIKFRGEVEDIVTHKLSDADRTAIRSATTMGCRKLANKYGVHFSMIARIRNGRR